MTPKNTADADDDDTFGVLDDTASLDTTSLGILGGTAQVAVTLPTEDYDDLADDGVVDDEIDTALLDVSALDTSVHSAEESVAEIAQTGGSFVIELPAVDAGTGAEATEEEVVEAEILEAEVLEPEVIESQDVEPQDVEPALTKPGPAEPEADLELDESGDVEDEADDDDVDDEAPQDELIEDEALEDDLVEDELAEDELAEDELAEVELAEDELAEDDVLDELPQDELEEEELLELEEEELLESEPDDEELVEDEEPVDDDAVDLIVSDDDSDVDDDSVDDVDTDNVETIEEEPEPGEFDDEAGDEVAEPDDADDDQPVAIPAARTEENTSVDTEDRTPVARPATEVTLASKRLDDLGESSRESADLLTADRLLDPHRVGKPEPEGTWSHLLYTLSGHLINIGDGRRARERKALTARISTPLSGTARFVPVLSRKGGVGKTTITALLGMALADARDDRVIAIDANPDRGTLAERVVGAHGKSVRDLVRQQHEIRGYHDVSALVARDETRLDVLASDADPRISEAFGDSDYRDVATVAAQYYSLVLTDSGTGIVHSVMDATLDLADQLVIVSGLSVDEARLASETLTWLETNGRAALARDAIVVLNQSTPGAPMVRLNELEAHFTTRAKHVVRVPYDPQVAGGGAIDFASLRPETRQAARELAARLIEGLRARNA